VTVNKHAVLRKVPAVIGLAAAAAALVLPGAASTAPTTKAYTANICASGPCAAPATPPTLAGGSTTNVALTLVNKAGTQSLGSANVTAPAGFKVNSVLPSPTGSSISGDTLIKLRNLNLAAGGTTTFTINVTVPCQPPSSSVWTIAAKQSNDFNGPPGNAFTLDPLNSSLTTPVTGACKLVFATQPANAQVGKTITSVADDPAGTLVQVEVRDGSNTLITTATGSVTLDPSSNDSSFSGTTSSLSGGVATFPSLASSATGTYRLTATGTGFASSDPSDEFTISDFGTVCPAGDTTCTGTAASTDKKTKASVTSTTSDGFGADTTLEITMLAPDLPEGACEGFAPAPGSAGVSVDVRPLTDLTQVTITLDKSIVNAFPENGVAHFNVCFGGKILAEDPPVTPFPTKPGTPVAQLIDGLYWGILPDCSGTPTTPCVASRNKTGSGNAVIVFDVPNPWDLKGYTG
jgi:hypothetical protein